MRISMADKELAAGRIRVLGPRHGKHAAVVVAVIKFGSDFITWIARAPAMFGFRILGKRVSPLNHEALDDPVKAGAVIEAFFGQGLEILDGFGRHVRPKLEHHFAFRGLNY